MKKTALFDMTSCALMAALMCVLCPVSVPVGPIPISLSILVILLTVCVLGPWRALVSYTVYLLLGAVGYRGFVSVEMARTDLDTVKRTLDYVAEVFQ